MSGVEKVGLIDTYFDGIRNADPSKFDAVCASNFVLALPQPTIGRLRLERAAAIDFLITTPSKILDPKSIAVEVLNVVEVDDEYVMEINLTANLIRGGVYDNIYILWFKFEAGKISMCRELLDTSYVTKFITFD